MTNTLGEARDYQELIQVLRRRAAQFGTPMEQLDEIAGLPSRYVSKLLAPVPIKAFGPVSLGPLLGALGLVLVVSEDAAALARVKSRLIRSPYAGSKMLAGKPKRRFSLIRGNPELARMMRLRQVLLQTQHRRKEIARNAAAIRWGDVKGARSARRRRSP
jgi:hypothetical protein